MNEISQNHLDSEALLTIQDVERGPGRRIARHHIGHKTRPTLGLQRSKAGVNTGGGHCEA